MKGFKKGTGIFQFLIDASVPNARLRAYSANLLARLRYIHMFMKYTVDFYGNELINNGSDSDTAFQIALRFDAAVNLYKSIQILACDYAEQYENTCFEDNTNKINDIEAKPLAYGPFWYLIKDKVVKERSWNSAAGCLAQVQRIRTQAIKCHEGELSDNSSEGLVHYKEDKLKIVTIACPVSVLVKDPKGKQVAYVSDDKISVSSGYEPYFNTYVNEGQSGSCTKIVIIPSDEDYEIQINGTNSGTMDVYIGEYEEREISGIEYITDVSVNRDSEIKLEQQNGHTVLRTDTDDIYPLNNDVEIWEGNIAAQFKQGDGTKENPYQISDGSELSLLSEMVSKGNDFENVYFLLVSDIDLGEVAFTNQNCRKGLWRPIGTNSRSAFKGNFDGNFHQITIKAAYQEAETINAGIFGYVSGTIQNLRTSGNIAIQSKQSVSGTSLIIQCGGICAYAEEAYIKNCENNIKCTVSCGSSFSGAYGVVGGIVGTADQRSEIVECINRQDISSNTAPGSRTDAMSGGIAAECINLSKITGCENYGTITAETTKDNEKYFSIAYPGGICGFAGVTGAISNCINYGKIRGKSNIAVPCDYQTVVSTGGIIGRNVDDKPEACIKNCANYSDDLIAEGSGFVDICQKGLIVGNFEKDGLKQNITVIDKMKLRYSDKRFDLDAVSDSGYLTYQSNNEKVISVSAKGRVYINGIGSAEITVSAPATEKYKAAAAVIPVSVEAGKIDFSKCSAALSKKTFLYNGKEQRPDVIVKNGEEELVNGIDFTISYKNNINVGTAEIVLTGIGEYQGSICIPFTIIAQGLDKEEIEISNAKIASIPAQIYTGKAVCPTVSITFGKKTLRENTDYILYYKNNIDPGTASIIVNGMGGYKGIIKLTFQIQAFLEKAEGLKQSKNGTKYITIKWLRTAGANGYIVYRSIAGKNHFTKIAAIKKSTTVTYKDKKVKTGTVYHYKIRAYRSINKKEYYSSYSDVLTANTKLAKTVFISVKSVKKRQAMLNWKKVPGAGGYEVYRSSMKNGKYVRIATIRSPKGQKYADKKGKSKKVYYYKVRAYKVVKGGKIYGRFSGLKRVKTK